jgi:DNA-binding CsgD family transcriptional regulator
MPSPETALQFALSLSRYHRRRDVIDALHAAVEPAQLNVYGAWRLPRRPANFRRGYVLGRNVFLHKSLPKFYWREFLRRARANGPSALALLVWQNAGPFTFTEGRREAQPSGADCWLFDLMDKFGIRDGLCCPSGRWTIYFWSRNVLKLSAEECKLLFFMAVMAAGRMDEMSFSRRFGITRRHNPKSGRGPYGPHVSVRELAVLQHISYGESDEEIAARLKLRPSTVRVLVHRAMVKFEAKTRDHAIAEALRMWLIR